MKRISLLLLAVAVAAITSAAQQQNSAQAQPSLGEAARKARTQQKAPAIAQYDEESFRGSQPSPPDAAGKADSADPGDADHSRADNAAQKSGDKKAAEEKSKDAEKSSKDLKDKIEAQKNEITMLQREVDVAQREQRLRAAAFYGDAGTQLRDQAKFAEESRKQQDEIDSKKQTLDAAQQKLADLEEQARKAGANK
jgi:chromosome segregation ATPase